MKRENKNLADTREMPLVSDETQIMPKELLQNHPAYMERTPAAEFAPEPAPTRKSYKKWVVLGAGGFFAAMVIGYATLSYVHDRMDLADNEQLAHTRTAASATAPAANGAASSLLGDVRAKTREYTATALEKKEQVQTSITKAQESIDEVKATAEKAGALKKEAEGVLREEAGTLAAVQAFWAEQQAKIMEFLNQYQPKK